MPVAGIDEAHPVFLEVRSPRLSICPTPASLTTLAVTVFLGNPLPLIGGSPARGAGHHPAVISD
jgi:hypothetical protein